jgi:hypothetical protein
MVDRNGDDMTMRAAPVDPNDHWSAILVLRHT